MQGSVLRCYTQSLEFCLNWSFKGARYSNRYSTTECTARRPQIDYHAQIANFGRGQTVTITQCQPVAKFPLVDNGGSEPVFVLNGAKYHVAPPSHLELF
jgi:hypothetical protein